MVLSLARAAPWLAVAAAVLLLDQLLKAWALAALPEGQRVPVLPGLNWRLAYNTGAAFSLLAGAGGWQQWLFGGLALGVSVLLTVLLLAGRAGGVAERLAFALIIGGAIGNLIDRLRHGAVVDFVELYWRDFHWPAFNLADAALSVAAVLLLGALIAGGRRARRGGAPRG